MKVQWIEGITAKALMDALGKPLIKSVRVGWIVVGKDETEADIVERGVEIELEETATETDLRILDKFLSPRRRLRKWME